jgi:hypothetical protein
MRGEEEDDQNGSLPKKKKSWRSSRWVHLSGDTGTGMIHEQLGTWRNDGNKISVAPAHLWGMTRICAQHLLQSNEHVVACTNTATVLSHSLNITSIGWHLNAEFIFTGAIRTAAADQCTHTCRHALEHGSFTAHRDRDKRKGHLYLPVYTYVLPPFRKKRCSYRRMKHTLHALHPRVLRFSR